MQKLFFSILIIFLSIGTLSAQAKKNKYKKTKIQTHTTTTSSSTTTASPLSGGATLPENEISRGLKEALMIGAKNAAAQLNKTDGFYGNPLIKIPFPENAKKVANELRQLGFGNKVDQFELSLNRAAEGASIEAAPIFINAITSMGITDAKNILLGSNNAATVYLQNKTSTQLSSAFAPHIKSALDSTSATKLWTEITEIYNKIPFVNQVDSDLTKYTTDKALTGLFSVVAEEEKKIRDKPAARITDILKKVFAK